MRSGRTSALLVVGAQAIGQIALIAVLPVLTRIFAPSELGLYQVALSIALVAQPLFTLRLEVYIPSAVSERRSAYLFRASMYWSLGLGLTVLFGVGVAGVVGFAHNAQAGLTSLMIALAYGWSAVDSAQLIRNGRRTRLAWRNLISGVAGALLQIGVGLLLPNVLLLAAGVLLGRLIAILVTREWAASGSGYGRVPLRTLAAAAPARPRLISVITSSAAWNGSYQSLTLISGVFLGSAASGYIGTAQRIAGAPIQLTGQSVNQLSQEIVSRRIRAVSGGLTRALLRQVMLLSVVALAIASIISLAAPPLAEPILGESWARAGIVAAILAWPLAFQLAIGPMTVVLPMLGHERRLLLIQMSRLLASVVVLTVAGVSGASLEWMCVLYAIVTMLGYLLALFVLIFSTREFDRSSR